MNDLIERATKLADNHERAGCKVTAATLRELMAEVAKEDAPATAGIYVLPESVGVLREGEALSIFKRPDGKVHASLGHDFL